MDNVDQKCFQLNVSDVNFNHHNALSSDIENHVAQNGSRCESAYNDTISDYNVRQCSINNNGSSNENLDNIIYEEIIEYLSDSSLSNGSKSKNNEENRSETFNNNRVPPIIRVSDYDEMLLQINSQDTSLDDELVRNNSEDSLKYRRYGVTSMGNEVTGFRRLNAKPLRGSYSFSYGRRKRSECTKVRLRSLDDDDMYVYDNDSNVSKLHSDVDDIFDNNVRPYRAYDVTGNTSESNGTPNESLESSSNDITDFCGDKSGNKQKSRKASTEEALLQVKETANRLRLHTRRASFLAWKEQYLDNRPFLEQIHERTIRESLSEDTDGDLNIDSSQTTKIDESFSWLRDELFDLRIHDKLIARQLLTLWREIQRVRLEKTCEGHVNMMEDLQDELEGLNQLCDLDIGSMSLNPLKHIGVTKLNLSERRFSTC